MDLELQEETVNNVVEIQNEQACKLELISNIAMRQHQDIKVLQEKLEAMENKKNKNNIIITGLKTEEGKTCSETVADFYKLKLEIATPIVIVNAYKRGKHADSPMCVVLKDIADKGKIYKHVKNLKGKQNEQGKSYQVRDDLTIKEQEHQNKIRQMMVRNKKSAVSQIKTSIKKNQLLINNSEYKQKVPAPSELELLTMSKEERQLVQEKDLVLSDPYRERDNVYYTYGFETDDIQEIRSIYRHLRLKHIDATHVMMAHNIEGEMPNLKDSEDNGECGGGAKILNCLLTQQQTNTAVFVVRYYSGTNLGKRCYKIIKEQTDLIIQAIKDKRYSKSTIKHKSTRVCTPKNRTWGKVIGKWSGQGNPNRPTFSMVNSSTSNTPLLLPPGTSLIRGTGPRAQMWFGHSAPSYASMVNPTANAVPSVPTPMNPSGYKTFGYNKFNPLSNDSWDGSSGTDEPETVLVEKSIVEAPLLLLLVTYSRSGVSSTFGARLCMAKTLKYLF